MFRTTVTLLLLTFPLCAQVRKLHTRDFTRLSQVQVAEFLKQSDIIFIPVGAVETNGIQPSGRDYTWPLAYAMAMAEETGGLYMPGLVWSYPGTTRIAPSSIHITPQAGTAFLKDLARSLLRQGFRRQVYLSASHGPAPLTAGTLVREFFEETHAPILYINMDTYLPRLQLTAEQRSRLLYGAFSLTGRIEDLPLRGDYGTKESEPAGPVPNNEGLATLGRLGFSGSLALGSWVPDVMSHGGSDRELPANAAERAAWGKTGEEQFRAVVKRMRMPEAMEALRQHDRYTQEFLVPKFRALLP
ncbi:MAG: creatininase family protein [Acidobacteria bacterium]|nr:creatininase family protein [Acidobacteriota bacterium]